jgi:hypothetical protein
MSDLPPLPPSSAFSLTRSVYTAEDMRDYASAALAAAQPAQAEPAAYVDERAISWLAERRDKPGASITTKLSAIKSFERPMPIYTAPPQPLTLSKALECVPDLIEVARMPNAEHVADAHNAAVRRLRAVLAAAREGKA